MDFYFNINNSTNINDVDSFLSRMFSTKKKVVLNINLREYSISFFHLFKFKAVLDKYRDYSREYILYTNVIIDNEIIRILLRTLLIFFEPENPVYISII